MQQHRVLLALSLFSVIPISGCGGGSNTENANVQTPSRSPIGAPTAPPSATPIASSAQAVGPTTSTPCTEANKPLISQPVDGGQVALNDIIRGTTPCSGMNHYVVVTPPDGANWVQNRGPLSIDPVGSFISQAQFGEGSLGIGDRFLVRILVTATVVSSGQLRQLPGDTIFSEAVSVTRAK